MFRPALLLASTASLVLTGCASTSQTGETPQNWGGQAFATWQTSDPAYRFFPGDTVEVTVHTAPELNRTMQIGPDGRVSLPLLGGVMLAQRTEVEAANQVANAYSRQALVNPIVEVRATDYGPQNIIVGGEVGNPGLIDMPGPVGAMEAVMLAGGFRNTAARGDVVVLRRAPGGGVMMRTVNLHAALRGAPDADPLQLRRSDIVFVPRSTIAEVNVFVEQYVYSIVPLDQAFSYAIADAITDNN